jgi:hypothetical protein
VRAALWATLVLAILSGCILLVDPSVCTANDQCAAGQACVSGDCKQGQAAADGGGTSGGSSGGTL